MRITGLRIDRFGVWSDLTMDNLASGMTVFFGPNEAGKSTLMQYIRTILYGFQPDRCERFMAKPRESSALLPDDRQVGGSLFVASRDANYQVRRYADSLDPLGSPGRVTVSTTEAGKQGPQYLATLLNGIDEAIYNNVFAVGLREVQKLASLDDTQAARQLYSLSTGTDRVSLVDVTRQLRSTKCRLVGCDDQQSLLGEFVGQQRQLANQVRQLGSQSSKWAKLVNERDELESEIRRLEAASLKTNQRAEVAEAALRIQPKWDALRQLNVKIESMGVVPEIPVRVTDTIASLTSEIGAHRQRYSELQQRRDALQVEFQQLEVNQSLNRHSARIHAMIDQRASIVAIDARVDKLRGEVEEAEFEIQAEQERLGLAFEDAAVVSEPTGLRRDTRDEERRTGVRNIGKKKKKRRAGQAVNISDSISDSIADSISETLGDATTEADRLARDVADLRRDDHRDRRSSVVGNGVMPRFDAATIAALQDPAYSLERDRQMLEAVKQEAAGYKAEIARLGREISESMGHDPDWFERQDADDVLAAMEKTTGAASGLRREMKVRQELEDLTGELAQIEDRRASVLVNQLLPLEIVKALGVLFSLGSMLFLAGLFGDWLSVPVQYRSTFMLMGVIGTAVASLLKFVLDVPVRDGMRDTQRQFELLTAQVEDSEIELEELGEQNAKLPSKTSVKQGTRRTGAISLRDTETRLVRLEALLPLENQRRGMVKLAEQAESRAIAIAKSMKGTRHRWEEKLRSFGLSTRVTAEQIRALSGEAGSLIQLHRVLDERRQQHEHAKTEQAAIAERLRDLMADALIRPVSERPSDRLNQLVSAMSAEDDLAKRQQSLKQREREQKHEYQKIGRIIKQLERRRSNQIAMAGAADEDDLLRMQKRRKEYVALMQKLKTLQVAIDNAIGSGMQEKTIQRQLNSGDAAQLPSRLQRVQKEIEQSAARLKELQYRLGQITEQIRNLANDRTLGMAHLKLGTIRHQTDEGIHKWKVVDSFSSLLASVYKKYEKDRQPDTLKEASRYLKRMTNGRYIRIWTPLAEDVLIVEDGNGRQLPIEVLSRGTREQLFLSLRLALVAGYKRRGVQMPVILDDVLVNFDSDRTESAAKVIADFARAGHQVLVFTCHRHIKDIFASLQVDVRDIPRRAGASAEEFTHSMDDASVEEVVGDPVIEVANAMDRLPGKLLEPSPVAQLLGGKISRLANEQTPVLDAVLGASGATEVLGASDLRSSAGIPLASSTASVGSVRSIPSSGDDSTLLGFHAPAAVGSGHGDTFHDEYSAGQEYPYASGMPRDYYRQWDDPPVRSDTRDEFSGGFRNENSGNHENFGNKSAPEYQIDEYRPLSELVQELERDVNVNGPDIPAIGSISVEPQRNDDLPVRDGADIPMAPVQRPVFDAPDQYQKLNEAVDHTDVRFTDEIQDAIGPPMNDGIDDVEPVERVNLPPIISGPAKKPRPLPVKPEDFADYPGQVGDGNLLGHDGPIAGEYRPDNAINPAGSYFTPSDTPLGFSEDPERPSASKDDKTPQIGNQPKQFSELLVPVENAADGPQLPKPVEPIVDDFRKADSEKELPIVHREKNDAAEVTSTVKERIEFDDEQGIESRLTEQNDSFDTASDTRETTMAFDPTQEELTNEDVVSSTESGEALLDEEYEYEEVTDELDEEEGEVAEDDDEEYEYVDVDEAEDDEYEYIEVDVDEDGNEIVAEDAEDDEEEYEDAEGEEGEEGEEDEYEYVEVDEEDDGDYEYEEVAEGEEEDDEYEYVDVEEDAEGEEGEDDEYEYVEVEVDEDGNEIVAEDDDEEEYEDDEYEEDEEAEAESPGESAEYEVDDEDGLGAMGDAA